MTYDVTREQAQPNRESQPPPERVPGSQRVHISIADSIIIGFFFALGSFLFGLLVAVPLVVLGLI